MQTQCDLGVFTRGFIADFDESPSRLQATGEYSFQMQMMALGDEGVSLVNREPPLKGDSALTHIVL